jgi:lysophospholipase L1-like esterase
VLRVPLTAYRENLTWMAETMRARGGDVAFLVLPCIKDPGAGKVGDFRDDYRAAMREMAGSLGAPLADAPPVFANASKGEFFDDVHPTREGHARLAEVVTTALTPWARGEGR